MRATVKEGSLPGRPSSCKTECTCAKGLQRPAMHKVIGSCYPVQLSSSCHCEGICTRNSTAQPADVNSRDNGESAWRTWPNQPEGCRAEPCPVKQNLCRAGETHCPSCRLP
jgi:hypothetical protein